MSSYIVEDIEINVIVKFVLDNNIETGIEDATPQLIGDALVFENYNSVNFCYSHNPDYEASIPHTYIYKKPGIYSDMQILKAVRHYNYQSCEHLDFEKTTAGKIIQKCLDHFNTQLLKTFNTTVEKFINSRQFDLYDWGITSATPCISEADKETEYEEIKEALKPKPKGFIVSVYRDADGSDCTMNGITSKHKRVTLIGKGVPEHYEASEDAPALYLREKVNANGKYVFCAPGDYEEKSYMMGGNFIYCCDSRISRINKYPIPVHDRCEG